MDFNVPQPTSHYALLLGEIRTGQRDLARMDLALSTNIPVGAIQWSAANARFEIYSGSTFGPLTTTYNIDVERLGGQVAAYYRNASNINAGTIATARLPAASTSTPGAVQLSTSTTSNSETTAATSSAVNALRQLADGKASSSHTHEASALPSATTSAAGIAQLNSSVASTSTSQAATPSAVRQAYNLASGKADTGHTHAVATPTANGFMSASDKSIVDALPLIINTTTPFGTATIRNNSTTLTQVLTVTVPVIDGRTYRLDLRMQGFQANEAAGLTVVLHSNGRVNGSIVYRLALYDFSGAIYGQKMAKQTSLSSAATGQNFATDDAPGLSNFSVDGSGRFTASETASLVFELRVSQSKATLANTTVDMATLTVVESG